jgi:hypothetical protein
VETSRTITLRTPIVLGKDSPIEYTEICLTEPSVGQLTAARKISDPFEAGVMLVHLNAMPKIPLSVVHMLKQRDFEECGEFFRTFQTKPVEEIDAQAADLTFFFHWAPGVTEGMSVTELSTWAAHARRIRDELDSGQFLDGK